MITITITITITSFSRTLESIGTTEIGRKSVADSGGVTLGIGWMMEIFHSGGTHEKRRKMLNSRASHAEQMGASTRRNQAGIMSDPTAIGLTESRGWIPMLQCLITVVLY